MRAHHFIERTGRILSGDSQIMTDRERTEHALHLLRVARDLLRDADCPKTLERVRLAVSSAKGAVRNQHYREIQR